MRVPVKQIHVKRVLIILVIITLSTGCRITDLKLDVKSIETQRVQYSPRGL